MRNVRTAVWVLGAAALAGCAQTPLSRLAGGVNPDSPAADAVREASARPGPFPDMKRLPPPPRDLRPVATYGTQAAGLEKDRGVLQAWAVAHPVMTDDPEGYASAARARTLDPAKAAPPADQAQRSEAWAEKMREAAKAPPPPPG